MRLTANIPGWPTYVIPKGKKTTCIQMTLWNHHYLLSLCFFSPNSSFQNFMGTNTAFVLTSLAGWLAASCLELCHESRRQVLLPKRIFCTRRLLQLQSAPYKHFQPIIGRKETCFPTIKNHCGLSNFSGIALWTSFTPFISSLWITQQSKDTQFVPVGCSVKAWINGFYADVSQRFKTWGPHCDLRSWRSSAMLEHAWARVRTAAPAFPCLWLCGEPDRQSSPNLPGSAVTCPLHLSVWGRYTDSTCANKNHSWRVKQLFCLLPSCLQRGLHSRCWDDPAPLKVIILKSLHSTQNQNK